MGTGWGLRDMQARCRELRDDLATLAAPVTAEELADYWPGGASNHLTGVGAWIYCYARYSAYLDRLKDEAPDPQSEQDADLAALQAFRDAPASVELVRAIPEIGSYLAVYPKSFNTLTLLDAIEEELRWLEERVLWLQRQWEADAPDKTGDALHLIADYTLYAVWICTTEGVGAPFDHLKAWPPIPETLRALESLDILNVMRAHHQVNKKRLALIANTLRKRADGEAKASWATLVMRAAGELRTPTDHLLHSRSFVSWFAQVAMTWEERAEAREPNAKASDPVLTEMVG